MTLRWRPLLVGALVGVFATSWLPASADDDKSDRPSRSGDARRVKADRPSRSGDAPGVKADRDGDGVFEDLNERLDAMDDVEDEAVLVVMDRDATESRVNDVLRRAGGGRAGLRFKVVDAFAARVNKRQARALANLPEVVHVELDSLVYASNDTARSSFGVDAAQAALGTGLDGDLEGGLGTYTAGDLVAAVIDTGIDASHTALAGKVIGFKDFVNGRTAAYDDEGHGTHVAGTIAGSGAAHRGVAPGAALVGVKVLDSAGSGTMSNVTAGIDWVVQNKTLYGIEAINLSLGTSGCSDGTDATSIAVNNAAAAGIVVAVAAGNSGAGTCTIGSPGAAADAVTVGAMYDLGEGGFRQAYFSSRGPTIDGRVKPDVSAPGVNITSVAANTGTGYTTMSGTSMATPFVAGVALLMREANSTLSAPQVKATVMATAIDWGRGGNNAVAGSTGPDIDYGAGRLDAYAAFKNAGAALPAAVPSPAVHAFYGGTLSGTGAQVDFPLTITDTTVPIAATLIHPGVSGATASSPDFDLYLYAPGGAQLATSTTTSRQDDLSYRPTSAGTYTLRVRSYAGSGAYILDVSTGLGADTTPPTVVGRSPAAGASGVVKTTNVTVTFSEAMDQAVTSQAFSLNLSETIVAGSKSWAGNIMTFNPTADLATGTYTASISSAAKDLAGNALAPESWTFTVVAVTTVVASPSATMIESGSPGGGNVASLGADDNHYFRVNSTTSGSRSSAWYATFTAVPANPLRIQLVYKGKNSRSCSQTVALRNWTTTPATWQVLDTRNVSSEVSITASPATALSSYVSPSGEVWARVACSTNKSFSAYGDLMSLTYDKAS